MIINYWKFPLFGPSFHVLTLRNFFFKGTTLRGNENCFSVTHNKIIMPLKSFLLWIKQVWMSVIAAESLISRPLRTKILHFMHSHFNNNNLVLWLLRIHRVMDVHPLLEGPTLTNSWVTKWVETCVWDAIAKHVWIVWDWT